MIDYQKDLPVRMKGLPVDAQGHPVPFFVAKVKGEYDFRIMDPEKISRCIRQSLCWVCGQEMGIAKGTFVIGPMCAVNRVSAEPPSHYDCAIYSAIHCPFLSSPRRKRRAKDLPEDLGTPAGFMIERNPGVTLVWTSRKWKPWLDPNGGILFNIGDAVSCRWFASGRLATLEEVKASIDTGLPALQEVADAQGKEAVTELEYRTKVAMRLVELTVPA